MPTDNWGEYDHCQKKLCAGSYFYIMKFLELFRRAYFLGPVLFFALAANAQDVIILDNGERVECRVLAIEQNRISYSEPGDSAGVINYLSTEGVRGIRYEDNSIQVIAAEQSPAGFTDDDYRWFASEDAYRMYIVRKSAVWGVKWCTWILTPFIGWIPAIPISMAGPDKDFLRFPDPGLEAIPVYHKEYRKHAHRIKSRAVWNGYLQATGDWFMFFPSMVGAGGGGGSGDGGKETIGKPPKNQPDRKNDPKPPDKPVKEKAVPVTPPQD